METMLSSVSSCKIELKFEVKQSRILQNIKSSQVKPFLYAWPNNAQAVLKKTFKFLIVDSFYKHFMVLEPIPPCTEGKARKHPRLDR